MITLSLARSSGGIGVVAQLVERFVRNEKVAGSIPASSTSFFWCLSSVFSYAYVDVLPSAEAGGFLPS